MLLATLLLIEHDTVCDLSLRMSALVLTLKNRFEESSVPRSIQNRSREIATVAKAGVIRKPASAHNTFWIHERSLSLICCRIHEWSRSLISHGVQAGLCVDSERQRCGHKRRAGCLLADGGRPARAPRGFLQSFCRRGQGPVARFSPSCAVRLEFTETLHIFP